MSNRLNWNRTLSQNRVIRPTHLFLNRNADVFSFDKTFSFGKYKGNTVVEVLLKDPHYVNYLRKNGLRFHLEVIKELRRILVEKYKNIPLEKKQLALEKFNENRYKKPPSIPKPKRPVYVFDEQRNLIAEYGSAEDAGVALGIKQQYIQQSIIAKGFVCGKYYFSYFQYAFPY